MEGLVLSLQELDWEIFCRVRGPDYDVDHYYIIIMDLYYKSADFIPSGE
jgi:hypothetical protein